MNLTANYNLTLIQSLKQNLILILQLSEPQSLSLIIKPHPTCCTCAVHALYVEQNQLRVRTSTPISYVLQFHAYNIA